MGIDMATYDELIAHQLSLEEIREHIGADSLAYLSHEGMLRAVEAAPDAQARPLQRLLHRPLSHPARRVVDAAKPGEAGRSSRCGEPEHARCC